MRFGKYFFFISTLASLTCEAGFFHKTPKEIVDSLQPSKTDIQLEKEIASEKFNQAELEVLASKLVDYRPHVAFDLILQYKLPASIRGEDVTLFEYLVTNKQFNEANELVKLGANIELRDKFDKTKWAAIDWAAAYGATELVKSLIAHGDSINNNTFFLGVTGEYHRKYKLSVELFKIFEPLLKSIDINYKMFGRKTTLYSVADDRLYSKEQRYNLAEMLLKAGADPMAGFKNSVTGVRTIEYTEVPLNAAKFDKELKELLTQYGAKYDPLCDRELALALANQK